ncbi:uncharacterized protein LOC129770262 isoform X2 [Toxorhynchites rutilus septentrionalis]|uniref:uncharacterized protein LOC129770262 isoform X2 n=1 Tax=Toxorhynchites rutilus septentrionalis TaxID=329112 RepID=UPI00247ADDCF|nr:uncharacterized protein LOC129770262 isoform X2 [Toxorhynchites rutilus septentrionalis]
MKLPTIIILLAMTIAFAYAIQEQHRKHRTAKLVRDFPQNIAPRLQMIEFPSYNIPNPYGPGTYAFGYEVDDPATGNIQFRDEEKLQNGTVRGSYGYMQPDGSVIITRFVADLFGYRATTEIKQADGQTLASIPNQAQSLSSQNIPAEHTNAAASNRYQSFGLPPSYNPALNPNFVDPQYTNAILSHIKNQQYYPSAGIIQYPYGPPMGQQFAVPGSLPMPIFYDAGAGNGNFFTTLVSEFPSSLTPSNLYNNLHTTFPNIVPQQNPFNTIANNVQQLAQNSPFGGLINNAQAQFQQIIPQNNPFAGSSSMLNSPGLPAGVYSDMPAAMGTMNRIPTTKRRSTVPTKKKSGYKTRDGNDWLDGFLETRKREVVFGLTTTTPAMNTGEGMTTEAVVS